jgi:hypothetical protein
MPDRPVREIGEADVVEHALLRRRLLLLVERVYDSHQIGEYSRGAAFQDISLPSLPFSDDGIDLIGTIPASVSGGVTIRVIDTDQTTADQSLSTLSIDRLWIRVVP